MPRKLDLSAWDKRYASKHAFPDLVGVSLSDVIEEIRSWSLDQTQLPPELDLRIQLRVHKIYCDMKRSASGEAEHRMELVTYIKYELTKHRRGRFPTPKIADVFSRVEALAHERIDLPDYKTTTSRIEPASNSKRSVSRAWARRAHVDELNTRDRFVQDMTRWHELKHPHIEQLLGACHVGERYFLSHECGDFEDLSTTLVNPNQAWYKLTKRPIAHKMVWRTLYNAALGLQFLHDRGIAHGNLVGSVVIPDGNVVKLRGFFWKREGRGDRAETLLLANDICDFGWCILEATSGPQYQEYSQENSCWEATSTPKWEWDPARPLKAFSSSQWSFLKSLLHEDPLARISINDMVRQLKGFAENEEHASFDRSAVSEQDDAACSTTQLNSVSRPISVRELLDSTRLALEGGNVTFSITLAANKQVFGRLADIHTQLLAKTMGSDLRADLWANYKPILEKFYDLVRAIAAEQSAVVRLASSRQASERNYELNSDLDRLCKLGNLSLARRDHDWRLQSAQADTFLVRLLSAKALEQLQATSDSINHTAARTAELTYLLFERNQRRSRYTSEELSELENAIQAMPRGLASVKARDPPWFIPPYEVAFDSSSCFRRGGFGVVHFGRWMDAGVVVKTLKIDGNTQNQADFYSEVSIWYQLNHPNIVKLFGACHVETAFFVCEHATNGQLDTHLNTKVNKLHRFRSDTWYRLCDAANGLRYLHERGIVHGDLKCNNILIGSDGLAKLADFGLSSFKFDYGGETKTTGAVRWTAPEVLFGRGSPSYASDVYSFGMCVIEAVSGKFPWLPMADVMVKRQLRNNLLPDRPVRFQDDNELRHTDKAWQLVLQMCDFEAEKRPGAAEVVEVMTWLSKNQYDLRRPHSDGLESTRP